MPDYIRRTRHRPRTTREVEILAVGDEMVVDFLRDLRFYEYVPSLAPLRREVIRLQAKYAKLQSTSRSGHWDALRKGLQPLINRFHQLLGKEGYEGLRSYLQERRRLIVKTIVFSESPY